MIKLDEIEKHSNCLQETIDKFGDQSFTADLIRDSSLDMDSPMKYLFLFDDFDQFASPRNLLEINKFKEWGRETKFIFAAPIDKDSETDKEYVNYFQF